jgi:hypothetical protein
MLGLGGGEGALGVTLDPDSCSKYSGTTFNALIDGKPCPSNSCREGRNPIPASLAPVIGQNAFSACAAVGSRTVQIQSQRLGTILNTAINVTSSGASATAFCP